MTPTPMESWIAALRSGEYTQTTTRLRDSCCDPPSYCCLGVACEVYRLTTGKGEWVGDSFHGQPSFLPNEVAAHFGLRAAQMFGGHTLIAYNDKLGKTFAEIADILEEEYVNAQQ